jgi:hypothetical protein
VQGLHPVSQAAAIAATAVAATVHVSAAVLGVPTDALLACYAGALFGLAYTKPESLSALLLIPEGSKWKQIIWLLVRSMGLLFMLTMNAFVAGWISLIVPHWVDIPQIAVGGLAGFGWQKLMPKVFVAAGAKIDGGMT